MISAVVITKNEEKNIKKCLESLTWCDEVIIVDDQSSDKTIEIAKKYGKVYTRNMNNDFATQRNFGLSKASHEWVLFIDGDEIVSSSLQFEILNNINNPLQAESGFAIKRADYMWGEKLQFGENAASTFVRLGKKDAGKWKGVVHETWKIQGKIGTLKNTIQHFPHSTLAEFLEHINYYSDLRAQELYKKKVKVHALLIFLYPTLKFLQNFIVRQGFRDGIAGLVSAITMSFYSFLVRGKLWQLWQKN